MSQEQQNYFNLITKNADPKVLTVDFAEIDRRTAQVRAEREAAVPPPGKVDLHKEGSERESVKSCILRGFPKGAISAPPAARTAHSRQNGR
jgi:hypothetical protein